MTGIGPISPGCGALRRPSSAFDIDRLSCLPSRRLFAAGIARRRNASGSSGLDRFSLTLTFFNTEPNGPWRAPRSDREVLAVLMRNTRVGLSVSASSA